MITLFDVVFAVARDLSQDGPTLEAIVYDGVGPRLQVLNQLRLPHEHVYEEVRTVEDGWEQIRDMKVCVCVCL